MIARAHDAFVRSGTRGIDRAERGRRDTHTGGLPDQKGQRRASGPGTNHTHHLHTSEHNQTPTNNGRPRLPGSTRGFKAVAGFMEHPPRATARLRRSLNCRDSRVRRQRGGWPGPVKNVHRGARQGAIGLARCNERENELTLWGEVRRERTRARWRQGSTDGRTPQNETHLSSPSAPAECQIRSVMKERDPKPGTHYASCMSSCRRAFRYDASGTPARALGDNRIPGRRARR